MIEQITKIAMVIILAISLTVSTAAQSQTNDDLAQIIALTGVETSRGTFEPISNMSYGNTFVFNGFAASETHHLTISLDYLCEQCDTNSHFPVTGGSWSLVVFRNDVYVGTLYGKVSGGAIDVVTNRNGEPGFRQMQINLRATGGLGRFAVRRGATNINGVYEAITDAHSNRTIANINFPFGL